MDVNRRLLLAALLCPGCLASPSSSSGGDGGPGGGDSGPGGGPCGTLASVSEDFRSPLSSWRWFVDGPSAEAEGGLQLIPDLSSESVLQSLQAWQVEGELVIGLDTMAMAPDATLAIWLSGTDGQRLVSLQLEGGTLRAYVVQPSFEGTRKSVTFDPAARWWRIGRANDRFQWATSPDGTDWDQLSEFEAELSGGAWISVVHTAGDSASVVAIEGINPGAPAQPLCPLSSLVDDFSAPSHGWNLYDDPACSVSFPGRAEITLDDEGACGLVSNQRFSLLESGASVEMTEVGDCTLVPTFEVLADRASYSFRCAVDEELAPHLLATAIEDGEDEEVASAPWNPPEHDFLRIRHAASEGGVVFETSSDGTAWESFGSAGMPGGGVDLTSVEVSLAGYRGATPAPPIAFDKLNAAP